MTIVATSSRYGGDFKGSKVSGSVGTGSELYVDEFELLYECLCVKSIIYSYVVSGLVK